MDWYWPTDDEIRDGLPGYQPTTKGHPRKIREAAELILAVRAPGHLRRRRHPQGPGRRGAAGAGRAHRHPRRHHADGPGRLPRRPPAVPRHAGHARQLHRRHVDAAGPTCSSPSASRFDDRVTGKVGGFAPDAKIIHVDIDPAELGKVRRPDVPIVGDCRLVIEELVSALKRPARRAAPTLPDRTRVEADDLAAGRRSTRSPTSSPSRATPSSRSSCSSSCATTRPTTRIVVSRRRPAPDVDAASTGSSTTPTRGSTPAASAPWASPCPAAIGAKVGRPDAHGVGRRRRRLLPDDGPGAGHRRRPSASRSRSPSSTTPTSAWSASGRRCSTRSATPRCTCRPTCPTTRCGPRPWAASACGSSRPRRSSRPSRRPTRSTTARSSSTSAPTAREKVFPMVPAGASNDDIITDPALGEGYVQ